VISAVTFMRSNAAATDIKLAVPLSRIAIIKRLSSKEARRPRGPKLAVKRGPEP
jgi:hypothetical protein